MIDLTSKQAVIAAQQAGKFGNRLRAWKSLNELDASGYRGNVVIRYLEPESPYCKYDVPYDEVRLHIKRFADQGADRGKFHFNEAGPDGMCFQGEVQRDENGYTLYWAMVRDLPMRAALKMYGRHSYSSEVLAILKTYMEPVSYDDLQELFDEYPNAVIEFSTFAKRVGVCCRETVIWEVREY